MTNLLAETEDAIARSGHTVGDTTFIGSQNGEYRCTWEEFQVFADREYDDGFGGAFVASDLIVLFADGNKLWRGEYDGSEWWEFDAPGTVDYSLPGKPITKVVGDLWPTVAELQKP